jgi:hypothetical protein
MNKDIAWQFLIGSLMIALVYMLVRPGAPVSAAIEDVSNALSGLIRTTTDYTVAPATGQPQAT